MVAAPNPLGITKNGNRPLKAPDAVLSASYDPPVSAPTLEIFERTDDFAIASWGPVLFQLWQRSTPVEGARAAREAAGKLAADGFDKTASLVIVPIDSAMPEKAARAELSQLPVDLSNGVGIVLVQEGSGFRAAAIRTILSTLMHLSRQVMPHDVVRTVDAGAQWLGGRIELPGGTAGLVSAVTELRGLYGPGAN